MIDREPHGGRKTKAIILLAVAAYTMLAKLTAKNKTPQWRDSHCAGNPLLPRSERIRDRVLSGCEVEKSKKENCCV
jgi:hypothetical protein